ncbi:MAG: hypothetical protein K5765_06950 [Clostridia bacterium]|nr:hypothetical protein [Clostridia bacterium]
MKTFKIGVKRFTDIIYNGEVICVNGEYWTTVEANSVREAKILASNNIKVRMAQNEYFIRNVRYWKNIYIDLSDMVVGE